MRQTATISTKIQVWVWLGDEWSRPSTHHVEKSAWLSANWRDGTTALVPPWKWRYALKRPTGQPTRQRLGASAGDEQ